MEISVSETTPGPSGIKTEPKEEDCEDLLSAFKVEPPPVKIENDDSENDEYGSLSEDYTVDIKKLKTEQSDDSKEWLKNYRIKSEENDQLAVSGEDQDDDFTEDNNIKSEEMHIKEDDGIDEPGMSPNSYDQEAQDIRRTTKKTNPVFRCPDCEFNTTRKRNMNRHLARHKREQAAKDGYACSKCNFKATTKAALRKHLHQHLSSKEATEYNCHKCEYTTVLKSRMARHIRGHTQKKGDASQTQYGCPECDYTTFQKWRMDRHMLIHGKHNEVTVIKCSDCDFNTTIQRDMTRHMAWHKRRQAAKHGFACTKCSFTATTKAVLNDHLLRHISSEQATEYICDICEYRTVYKSRIERHLTAHTKKGERRAPQTHYGCPECDYTTFLKRRIELHMLIHGNPNDVTVFKCYHCSYETLTKKYLKYHLRWHRKKAEKTLLFEEHLRLNCGKSAENKQVSVINVADLVDNYMFRCQDCDYKTNWSSSFTVHVKQHETPKNKRKSKSC